MKHMCRSCDKSFAECQSNPVFASETDDRVIDCDIYKETENYDKMNVEDLLPIYNWQIVSNTIKGVDIVDVKAKKMFASLRKAVIREASAGTVYVARDGTDGCPEFRFRCAESLTAVSSDNVCQLCRELMPERQYVLIPSNLAAKETP